MARFRLEIFKSLSGETWENRYHIEATTFTTAVPLSQQVVEVERSFHGSTVLFEYARISTVVEGDNLFVTVPIELQGLFDITSSLPLFNVMRVNLAKELTRPDFKLYRGCLGENNTEAGIIAPTFRANVTAELDTLVEADPPIIWPISGDAYTDVTVESVILQRSLRRRKRRVLLPTTPLA